MRTFALAIPAAVISSFLGAMNGFVLSRWRFPHADMVFTFILFGMFIPYQAIMTPLVQMKTALGLPSGIARCSSCTSSTAADLHTDLPQLLRRHPHGADGGVPGRRGRDAAHLRRIVLPLSLPGFVVTIIWQFTSAWNDFLFALFLTNARAGRYRSPSKNLAQGAQLANYGPRWPASLIASLPTLMVYIVLGKYFIGGLMSGSVKS